jgi:formylglycine-generating enzyme required for sulfatase activity/serine/threonine protein kinase
MLEPASEGLAPNAQRAAELFAGFVTSRAAGEAPDFEALCRDHPELEHELRVLESHWERVAPVIARLGGSLAPSARTPSGAGARPPSAAVAGGGSEHEVLRRLSGRRPATSRYAIQGEVARGGMGAILRVWDEDLRRNLAMKVVLGQEGKTSGQTPAVESRVLDRFLEEAQVTSQLEHPGIVPVHELGIDAQGRVFFTMRLVSGRDLERIFGLVREGQENWTQTRAVGVVLKICEAMAYAHDKGVLHRDLKPANVMVGRFGEVYVMDWGLARVLGREDTRDLRPRTQALTDSSHVVSTDRLDARQSSPLHTMDGDVVGTPAYMSPEQARGDLATMGPASDVYAVGAILYHLLAGHMPYAPPQADGALPGMIEVWQRVRAGSPEPLEQRAPESPAELIAICEKAMAREPKDRYASMQELADDLRAYLEGRVVRAYETGAVAEFKKWVVRNKALAVTTLVALLLILVGTTTASLVLANKNEELGLANVASKKSELRATQNAAIAEERATRILRLSDIKRLQDLTRQADTLWPAHPENAPALETWTRQAKDLLTRLPEHRAALEELRQRALPPTAAEAPGEGEARKSWEFSATEDRWQHDTQAELVANLEAFADPKTGLLGEVERRLDFARTVGERTVDGPQARALWSVGAAAIGTSARYGGLVVHPQIGLLPLGQDPHSGLWEFAHLQTGTPPVRDPQTGELALTEDSGLVFVLIPGGTFSMGAQGIDAAAPNYDPEAQPDESPVRFVTLAPFFLSKYELTQGQWLRTTGKNPSIYGPSSEFDGKQGNLLHPVEQVSWTECAQVLARLGLQLPTEAQWEYAARAGTATPWWTGAERNSLEGAANLCDRAAKRVGATWPGIDDWPELDDGFAVHAPVDAYRPNAFGLHNVHGNVWEWCRDAFAPYGVEPGAFDGERKADPIFRVSRGGSFFHPATHSRSANRNNSAPETRSNHLGVRASREVGG